MNIPSAHLDTWSADLFSADLTLDSKFRLLQELERFVSLHYGDRFAVLIQQRVAECLTSGNWQVLQLPDLQERETILEISICSRQQHQEICLSVYKKPFWTEIAADPSCYINIFYSILQQKPAHLLLFDRRELLLTHGELNPQTDLFRMSGSDFTEVGPEAVRDMFGEDCFATLERAVQEKRFMMLQVKNPEKPDNAILKVFEPVTGADNEVHFVFLAVFRLDEIKPIAHFVLNQFLAIENAMDGIALLDEKGEYYYLNDTHVKMFGYDTEQELLGRKWQIIYPENEIQRINDELFPLLMANGKWSGETKGISKQGRPVYQDISLTALPGGGLICVCRDIGERKVQQDKLEINDQTLRKSQMLLEMALGASGNAVWEWDIQTNGLQLVNFYRMLGYDESTIQPSLENYFSLIHLDDLANTLEELKNIRHSAEDTFEYQERLKTNNGTYIWVLHRSKVMERDAEGHPLKLVGNTININPLKVIEEQLVKSENRWKKALEGSGAGIGEIDFDRKSIWLSHKAAQLLGYESNEEVSELLDDYMSRIHPDDVAGTLSKLNEHLEGRISTYEYEYRLLCQDGQYRWFDFHGIISRRDPEGRPLAFIGSAYDITDRKEFEEKLKLSEERWKFAIDGAKAGIYDWNILSNEVYYSDRAKELHGIYQSGNTFNGDLFFDQLIYKDDIPLLESEVKRIIEGRIDRTEIEYRIVHPIQGIRWLNDRAMVVQRNDHGVATRVIGIYFDITERKNLEDKIRESEQRWIFALEGSSSGVWDYNLNTGEVFYSNKLKELMGYTPEDPFENSISQFNRLVHPEDRELALDLLRQYLDGSIPVYENEQRAMHKDGTYHWYLNKGIIANRDEKGVANRVIGTVADITSRKKNELELIKAKELAEASAKAKRAFLANMSHEIRTPMNAIIGLSEQMRHTELTQDQQFLMTIINDAARSLQVLIDDILDFTKIEEGQLKMEHIEFDLSELLKRLISLLLHKAQEKQISLKLDYDWRVSAVVKGDPNRLNQVLINIVGNAIKFTSEGYVKLSCTLKEKKGNHQWLEFVIADTGIGMAEEALNNLFKEFYQEDQSIARKFGGTGLGLSITRNLVQLMNGSIRVESKKHKGTQVFINLPFEISHRKYIRQVRPETPAERGFFSGKRILLVEDNKVNRIVASIILRKMDILLDEAENGKAALYMLEENDYDLILMDLQMPELDGISATEIIRKNEINTPIIALTANAIQEELEELAGKGFNGYVVKPFEEVRLLQKMQEAILSVHQVNQGVKQAPVYMRTPKKDIGELILENSGGSPETESALVFAFKFEIQSAIEELDQAIRDTDLEIIKRVAHKQKSMLLSLGLKDESKTIMFLSRMEIKTVDQAAALRKCRSLLRFFRKIYARVLELYPENGISTT